MAIKKEKLAFGIYKDGLKVKIAQLSLYNGIVSVQSLEETKLTSELLEKEIGDKEKAELSLDKSKKPDGTEMGAEAFSMKMLSELENLGELDGTATKEHLLPGLLDLQHFLQHFPLEKGKISLNANDEQISYFQFDSLYGTANLRKRLLRELLSEEEIKTKNYSFDYILNPDKSGLAFVHTGKFRFFHALRDINLILSKEKYYYNFIDANPVSLINIVNNNYDFFEDDYVMILYIGFDYKVGIVLKNGMHVKTFPIIVPDDDEVSMREIIYSKVLLEQDISDIPITKNILLAGDNITDEDLEYYRSAAQEGDEIARIDLRNLSIQEGMEETITLEKIANYAIPIALAWKTLEPKNKKFNPTNLLPNKVIKNQNYFKIAWHGFLIMAAILFFAFTGLSKNIKLKQEISSYEKRNYGIKQALVANQILIDRLNVIKEKISTLQESIERVTRIIGNKNQWNHILDVFSRSLDKNRLSWFRDITSNNDGFTIKGYTTNRRAVIALSRLFPESRITKVAKTDIYNLLRNNKNKASSSFIKDQELTIWDYIFSVNYPDPESWNNTEEDEVNSSKPTQQAQQTQQTKTNDTTIEEIETKPEKDVVEEETSIEKVEKIPDVINEKYHTILSLYFSGKTNDAYEQFSEFVASYPEHKMAYYAKYLIGECLFLMERYPEARETLEQVYKLKGSKSPDALIVLGNCSEEENDLDTAIQYWSTLIEKYPNNDLSKIARYKIDKIKGR